MGQDVSLSLILPAVIIQLLSSTTPSLVLLFPTERGHSSISCGFKASTIHLGSLRRLHVGYVFVFACKCVLKLRIFCLQLLLTGISLKTLVFLASKGIYPYSLRPCKSSDLSAVVQSWVLLIATIKV